MEEKEITNRHKFFIERLAERGMYDEDSDYDGMLGEAVEELSLVFAEQGHSGASAFVTLSIFFSLFQQYDDASVAEAEQMAKDEKELEANTTVLFGE